MSQEIVKSGKLNEVIITETRRPNGTIRRQQDFEFCPSMAEQHTGHLTDLNYLIEKHTPDELAAYISARSQFRQEIIGHDFSQEPSLQEARNIVYQSKQAFEALPDDVKNNFKNHLEFVKFIDNPANAEKLVKMGLITPKEIETIQTLTPDNNLPKTTPTPTTQEEKK